MGNEAKENLEVSKPQEGEGGDPDDNPKDKHGHPGISLGKYERDMKEKDDRIAELEAQHAERLSAAEQERKRLLSELDELRPQVEEYGRVKAHIADIELSARERADALDAATRERLQAMIAACRGHCEQVLSTLGATCESVSNELKRADAAVAQLPEAFTTLEGQLDELKKLEQ